MKIGILNAIHPAQSQVNWGGSPVEAYKHFLAQAGMALTCVGYEAAQGELPPSVDACDAYLISGSPRGVYDSDPWIADLLRFVQAGYQAGRRLVGICFGHQLLAHALGGHAEKSEKGWGLGLRPFAITQAQPWMRPYVVQSALYFAHQDQVTRLPPGATLLGGNAFCPHGMFVMADRVLGIQGHPEFSQAIMEDVLARAREDETVDRKMLAAATASLEESVPGNQLFAQWVVNFLTA